MKPEKIAAIVVSVLLIVGAIAYFVSKDSSEPAQNTNNSSSVEEEHDDGEEHDEDGNHIESEDDSSDISDEAGAPTAEQVALHNNENDCWTIINGSVYDITSYIPRHPGGDEILRACGADGSTLFNSRTTTDGEEVGTGTAHSSTAASQLESLKIGELSE